MDQVGGYVLPGGIQQGQENANQWFNTAQQAPITAEKLKAAQIQNQGSQIGLDEMRITQPDRLYKSAMDAAQGANTFDPKFQGTFGLHPNEPLNLKDVQDAVLDHAHKKGGAEAMREHFAKLSPEEQGKLIGKLAKEGAADNSKEGLHPIVAGDMKVQEPQAPQAQAPQGTGAVTANMMDPQQRTAWLNDPSSAGRPMSNAQLKTNTVEESDASKERRTAENAAAKVQVATINVGGREYAVDHRDKTAEGMAKLKSDQFLLAQIAEVRKEHTTFQGLDSEGKSQIEKLKQGLSSFTGLTLYTQQHGDAMSTRSPITPTATPPGAGNAPAATPTINVTNIHTGQTGSVSAEEYAADQKKPIGAREFQVRTK